MASNNWETFRKLDREVLDSFSVIANAMAQEGPARVVIHLAEGYNQRTEAALGDIFTQQFVSDLLKLNESIVYYLVVSIGQLSVHVTRDRNKATDSIAVNFHDGIQPNRLVVLLTESRKQFPSYTLRESTEKILGAEAAKFYQSREAVLTKLEATTQQLIVDTTNYRLSVDQEAEGKEQVRVEVAKNQRLELQAEFDGKAAKLAERESALDKRAKSLDDQDSRHARRALRNGLQEELKARASKFSLTEGTVEKRGGIHALFISLLLTILVVLIVNIQQMLSATDVTVLMFARGFGAMVGLVTVSFFYMRWMDNWFRQHADEEFRLKRLALDIDRASLVVETALEWQQQSQVPIPTQLLQQLCHGLFESSEKGEILRHPVEELTAALLSASASVKIPLPGGGEATLDRKGVQQLNAQSG